MEALEVLLFDLLLLLLLEEAVTVEVQEVLLFDLLLREVLLEVILEAEVPLRALRSFFTFGFLVFYSFRK